MNSKGLGETEIKEGKESVSNLYRFICRTKNSGPMTQETMMDCAIHFVKKTYQKVKERENYGHSLP